MKRGFSLVELLVVVAIIVALLAILTPALGRAAYTAQTTICVSHQHQRAMAILSYAQDHFGVYPNHAIPRGVGLNPWGLGTGTLPKMTEYGLPWPVWFCPVTEPGQMWAYNAAFNDANFNVPASVIATQDPVAINNRMSSHYPGLTISQLAYWVPTEATNGLQPHDGMGPSRNVWGTSEWPVSVSRAGSRGGPLIGDVLYVNFTNTPISERSHIKGGHLYGGRADSAGCAWPDGSARLRRYEEFELVQDQHYGVWY